MLTKPGMSRVLSQWLQRPRPVEWRLILGLDWRSRPVSKGTFNTSLAYLDDQGEKWGGTYVKVVGQHFDDYSHWDAVESLLPLGGPGAPVTFVPRPFSWREVKGAAPGVTGLIGEVLITVFLQQVLRLSRNEVAHLKEDQTVPDLCLDIEPRAFAALVRIPTDSTRTDWANEQLATQIEQAVWSEPLPVECKSRRSIGARDVKDALRQLVAYWRRIPQMAGHGLFAQINVFPSTVLNLHLTIPAPAEAANVRAIITGQVADTGLVPLSEEPTYTEFQDLLGGRLIG